MNLTISIPASYSPQQVRDAIAWAVWTQRAWPGTGGVPAVTLLQAVERAWIERLAASGSAFVPPGQPSPFELQSFA